MVAKKRDTVGKLSLDLLQKEAEQTDAIELGRAMRAGATGSEIEDMIIDCVEDGQKKYSTNFYVVILQKKERLMQNVVRNYILHRLSCPTPNYDQTVYLYNKNDDMLEFIWVIPSEDTCLMLRDNALQIPDDEKDLLNFVLDFYDGTLLKIAKRLNGELK
jgi:hypothetical protein